MAPPERFCPRSVGAQQRNIPLCGAGNWVGPELYTFRLYEARKEARAKLT